MARASVWRPPPCFSQTKFFRSLFVPDLPLIDLRSDTVTKPNAAMRAAMAEAEVGDDVYGEDPTVNRLEQEAARIAGKEAALFVPSGTMGNNIAIKMHTRHGDELLCESRSHVFDWELAMVAWFAGCLARPIATEDGILTWKKIQAALRTGSPHNAATTLICLENTHNMAGGTVYPLEVIDEICAKAHERGVKVHMDGARVFNASAALGIPVARIVRNVDSVMFCLSKGLGAPIGSMLAGTAQDIEQARLYRKRLGGGMRQAGILAAAGLIALLESPEHLAEDHANARFLAGALGQLPGIQLISAGVRTNIVIFDVSALGLSSSEVVTQLRSQGVLAGGVTPARVRLVTHRDVSRADCERAADALAAVAARQGTATVTA
ncbi:MAG TPA: GntG family PLP-dependent aldolase [Bryobacteraceae bacterium]|nr:GntG family PLP-dependent aldolase [Bryobacteraceae bacterium]